VAWRRCGGLAPYAGMTGSNFFGVEQLVLLALLGVGITLAGLFRHRWLRLRRWFDRQSLQVVGLITLGVAAALGLLIWWLWPLA
jgi:H+/Cl- antiporter ClcA